MVICSKISLVGEYDNAQEAIEFCKTQKVDVAVISVILKGTDGFEVLNQIKRINDKIKIIMISSLGGENYIKKAINLGADYYMIKPINSNILVERILDLLNLNNTILKESSFLDKLHNQLDDKITNIFISVGIPAHIKGYQFLREAIKMAVDTPEVINKITNFV